MADRVEALVTVSGRVQGVCFRAATREEAARAGVVGYVRNLPDRRVEAVVQGSEAAVRDVIAFMEKGPPGARVEGITVDWRPPGGPYGGFVIRY